MKPIIALIIAVATSISSGFADTTLRMTEVCSEGTTNAKSMILSSSRAPETLWVKDTPIVDQNDIKAASSFHDENGYGINIVFSDAGAKKFDSGVQDMQGKKLAIIINDQLVSAPTLQTTHFGGRAQITGNFTKEEVESIVASLNKTNKVEQGAAANP